MKKTPLRSATARTADSSTRESKIDTITSPPLTSSTKGKKKKSNARAINSSTVEKRWNLLPGCNSFGNSFPCAVSFIQPIQFSSHDRLEVPVVVPLAVVQLEVIELIRYTRCCSPGWQAAG